MAKANPTTKVDVPPAQTEHAAALAPTTVGAAPAPNAGKPDDFAELCNVRVLASVTIGETRYQPDMVIEGLPVATANANRGSVDQHPDAVAYARSIGAPVLKYEAA